MHRIYATVEVQVSFEVSDNDMYNNEFLEDKTLECVLNSDWDDTSVSIDEKIDITEDILLDESDKVNDDIALGLM